jgi:hypothetical protein
MFRRFVGGGGGLVLATYFISFGGRDDIFWQFFKLAKNYTFFKPSQPAMKNEWEKKSFCTLFNDFFLQWQASFAC